MLCRILALNTFLTKRDERRPNISFKKLGKGYWKELGKENLISMRAGICRIEYTSKKS